MVNSLRVTYASPTEFYVIAPLDDGSAISYRFQKGIVGTSSIDNGLPAADWRRTGEYYLTSPDLDPTGTRTVIGDGIGAFDYAFYSYPNLVWGGSYHGGETLLGLSGSVVTGELIDSNFEFTRHSLVSYDNGDTVDVTMTDRVNADGSYYESITATSSARITTRYLGIEVGNGPNWNQISTDGGLTYRDVGPAGNYSISRIDDVILRNAQSGLTMHIDGDATKESTYVGIQLKLTGDQTKLYYDFGGGILNNMTVAKTTTFVKPDIADDIHITTTRSLTLAAYDNDLTLLGTAAISGTGNGLDNHIIGNSAGNTLAGMAGNDILEGGDGNDLLNGGGGDDHLIGGGGVDTAVFNGNRADFLIENVDGGVLVTHLIADGEGADLTIGVEYLQFNDVIVANAAFLKVSDAGVVEGDDGQTMMAFTVSLTGAVSGNVTVDYASADGTARDGIDYLATTGSTTFLAGETSKTIYVPVFGDTQGEPDETLTLTLANATGATIVRATGVGTIFDDGDNNAPTANSDVFAIAAGETLDITSVDLLANDTDPDGDLLRIVSVAPGTGGDVMYIDQVVTFTATPGFSGEASFSYTVIDAKGAASIGTVLVQVGVPPANTAPEALADTYSANEDGVLSVPALTGVLANDTDVDGSALSALLVDGPQHGSLVLNLDGSFQYTPLANYNGTDGFTYRADDGDLQSPATLVTLNVASVNDAPVATDDGPFTTGHGARLDLPVATLLGNDSDPDGDPLSIDSVFDAVGGTVSLDAGVVSFTPFSDFSGSATFSYRVVDGHGGSAVAAVIALVEQATATDDLFFSTAADETFDGGAGTDTVSYAQLAAGVSVSLAISGPQQTGEGGTDTLIGIENLTGTRFADHLTGDALANRLDGMDGDDVLDGGAGADWMSGGKGNDTYYVDNVGDVISQDTGGTDQVFSSVSFVLDNNLENLTLLGTADINGTGQIGNNSIVGNSGNNTLSGGAGYDTLSGGAGNDILYGGAQRDNLFGGSGNDLLDGGEGADWLSGGAGSDRFLFNSAAQADGDWIQDFGPGDRIDLSPIDAAPGLAGDQAFHFIGASDFSGSGGELRVYQSNGSYFAAMDIDGNLAPDATIRITAFQLATGDFIL